MNTSARPISSPSRRKWSIRDTLRSLDGGPGYDGPLSDHFDGFRFFNPGHPGHIGLKEFLRWQRTRNRKPWPQWVENGAHPMLPPSLEPGQVALTFVNHITFLLQFRGLNILTDPVYSQRVSPFRSMGPKRVRAPGLAFESLPALDVVLITHNHYDHLDIETLLRIEEVHSPRFVTTLGNRAFLEQFGLRNVAELDWWQGTEAPGIQVTLTPARHWSSRRPRNRNRTLWGGFVVQAGGRQVFFAGDTAYADHFQQVRERFGELDLALLPIGAYEPRWFMQDQHMNPDDAVRAHIDLKPKVSVGTHFGCFQLTDEAIDEPVLDLAAARERHGLKLEAFQVLETGETRLFAGQGASFSSSAPSSALTSPGPR